MVTRFEAEFSPYIGVRQAVGIVPARLQPACVRLGCRRGQFPVTERATGRILSLPMSAELSATQREYVAKALSLAVR
jgi:dTDP-4-amino-4,6-dideoxygalactose transaminase